MMIVAIGTELASMIWFEGVSYPDPSLSRITVMPAEAGIDCCSFFEGLLILEITA